MRPTKALLLSLSFLACAIPAFAVTPEPVQTCQKANGGTAAQMYTVTIAGSGGTKGCTSKFAKGDALIVAYFQQSGSDRTTSNISATGAKITWRKAISIQKSVFGPPGYFAGIFYACPSDIRSPTSSIAITVDMGASMAGITSISVQEVQNIQPKSCLDKTAVRSTSCTRAEATVGPGTLSNASEYVFAATLSCPCAGSFQLCGIGNEEATEDAVTRDGTFAFDQAPAGYAQNIVGAIFVVAAHGGRKCEQ